MTLLKNLNTQQRESVLHSHESEGPLLILAGAGSGKTSVLTKRILYRIEQGLDSSKILALTFTAKAAAEMDERVKELAPDSKALLCTFHSLALRLLRTHWEKLGFAKVPIPKEQSDFEWQDWLMEAGLKPGSVNRENLFCNDKLAKLQAKVFQSSEVVFEDLIWLAIRLLLEFNIQIPWTEILIDEYQDINPSQYKFVRALLRTSQNLFAVGDDDQAIYGFRGADIGNILRFKKDFPNCKVLKLEWNYRSTANILEAANRIFADKPLMFRKNLRAGAMRSYSLFKENRKPEVWVCQTAEEEILRVAHEIKFLKDEYSMQWSDFALLCRYNRQCEYYELALKEYGIGEVVIETLHASKGLQYPVVFYCGLAENLSPGQDAALDEEKRLFYVGVTRAEAHLIFLYCKQRYFKGQLTNFKKSRFLKYCQEKPLKQGIKMPVFVFKIFAVFSIICFMCWYIPIYFFQRLLKKSTSEAWLQAMLLRWANFCLRRMRINLSVSGRENLAKVDWSRGVVVIANHNSFADIPVILVAAQRMLGFLAKMELSRIPFLSYWMRKIGCVFIKRSAKGASKNFKDKMSEISAGKHPQIVIFPEGTRSKTGEMGSWKSGAFRMATEFKAIILPIVLKGTASAWEKRTSSKTIQHVTAQILEPLDVSEYTSQLPVTSHLRSLVQQILSSPKPPL